MKITTSRLRSFVPELGYDARELRVLFDEAGIEVESIEPLESDDLLIDVELLANRGDHRGYAGIAAEVSAAMGRRFVLPPVNGTLVPGPRSGFEDEAVLVFAEARLDLIGEALPLTPEPDMPTLTGIPILDSAAEIGVLWGHPLQVYDADVIQGALSVRRSRDGDTITLVAGEPEVDLPAGLLVVVDSNKIVSVAGVVVDACALAGEHSRSFIVESALFDPVEVRRAASALGLSTPSSQRLERGGDADAVEPTLLRLIERVQPWAALSGSGRLVVPHSRPPVTVYAEADGCGRLLGADVLDSDFAARLSLLGFNRVSDGWVVPEARRWDVVEAEDLYEEYARIVGYDVLPASLPDAGVGSEPTLIERGRRAASEVLHAFGFFEVVMPGFYSRTSVDRLGLPSKHPLQSHVETIGSHDKTHGLLKNNSVVTALDALQHNQKFGSASVALYETASMFRVAGPDAVDESRVLWAIGAGDFQPRTWSRSAIEFDVHTMVGLVREIGRSVERSFKIETIDPEDTRHPYLHPYRAGSVSLDGRTIGFVGEIHPAVVRSFGLHEGTRPIMLELDETALIPGIRGEHALFPSEPVRRMLDLVVRDEEPAQALLDSLLTAAPSWMRFARVVDVFKPRGIGNSEKSVTFEFEFEPKAGRRVQEFNDVVERMLDAAVQILGRDRVRRR